MIGDFPRRKPQIGVFEREKLGDHWSFRVRVTNEEGTTEYDVVVKELDWEKLTRKGVDASTLVKKSFEFLLAREPKESILRKFDLWEIQEYFPEYEEEIRRSLVEE